MPRRAAIKYLMGLGDEEFAAFISKLRLLRLVKRDGFEEAKNTYSFIVTSHLVVPVQRAKTK